MQDTKGKIDMITQKYGKYYIPPKAKITEFECEDIITASSLKTNDYTKAGTRQWFAGLSGSTGTAQNNSWSYSVDK